MNVRERERENRTLLTIRKQLHFIATDIECGEVPQVTKRRGQSNNVVAGHIK